MLEHEYTEDLRGGSQLAFTHIYRRYAREAYLLAFKYLGDKEMAEDAVQNLFMKLWNMREDIDPAQPLNHLLFRILRNDLVNTLRNSRRRCFIIDDCLEVLMSIDEGDDESMDIEQQKLEIINKAIQTLPPQRRKVFQMKISRQYSNQEIAGRLGLSVNTVKFQYSQALRQIRDFARRYAPGVLLLLSAMV